MTVMGYRDRNVLDAARERMRLVYDRFEHVVVSVSGGKDSTAIRHLAIEEGDRRGRKPELFFLDQEAEYRATIDVIEDWMHDSRSVPRWYQVPLRLTNATSHLDHWLRAWGAGEDWMRPKDAVAIQSIDGDYPDRFYDFFPWLEANAQPSTAFVIGLRTRESFNRYRAMSKGAAVPGWCWSTKTTRPDVARVYPIYDWVHTDVWKLIRDERLRYNRVYDLQLALHGPNVSRMRVSNLVHEQAFRCLTELQELEPETYERLVLRLGGVHAAALYARDAQVYDAVALPPRWSSWRAYRDHILETTPTTKRSRYVKRFGKQPTDEETFHRQVKQLLRNDWENNVPVAPPKKDRLRQIWWDRL